MEAQLRLLTTIPGIDRDSACTILIELGPDIRAFGSEECLAAWAEPYYDRTADYEALMVKRNAPRWIRMLHRYGYIVSAQA